MKNAKTWFAVLLFAAFLAPGASAENTLVKDNSTIIFYGDGKTELARQKLDENGVVVSTTGTIPDGPIAEYDSSGRLLAEHLYQSGVQAGVTKLYFKSGKLRAEVSYANDLRDGDVKYYFESGAPQAAFTYKGGKREGSGKAFTEKGKVIWEAEYAGGMLNGTYKQYFENGKPAVVETYSIGTLKERKAFDNRGAAVKIRTVELYTGNAIEALPHAVAEYAAGKYITLSKLALSADGLSGSVQCATVQDAPFTLVVHIKTPTAMLAVYKDAETELTAAYSARQGLVPAFSTRGYTVKGKGRQVTLSFSIVGNMGGVYDVEGDAKTVSVYCIDGTVDPHSLPTGEDGVIASISNVLSKATK